MSDLQPLWELGEMLREERRDGVAVVGSVDLGLAEPVNHDQAGLGGAAGAEPAQPKWRQKCRFVTRYGNGTTYDIVTFEGSLSTQLTRHFANFAFSTFPTSGGCAEAPGCP